MLGSRSAPPSVLKVFEQLDMVFNQTNTSSWLYQGNALFFCFVELVGEDFVFRQDLW